MSVPHGGELDELHSVRRLTLGFQLFPRSSTSFLWLPQFLMLPPFVLARVRGSVLSFRPFPLR